MPKTYERSLFIFRRDLRLQDNTALLEACSQSEVVAPLFVFDPRQVSKHNEYYSANAVQFMIESLKDLQKQLAQRGARLYLFHAQAEKIIPKIATSLGAQAVFFNKDYTPFSLNRDRALTINLERAGVATHAYQGLLLTNPEEIFSGNGTPYTIFAPFFKKASSKKPADPQRFNYKNFYTKKIDGMEENSIFKKILKTENPQLAVHGGTQEAYKILEKLGTFADYPKTRNFPEHPTTRLSAHLKFGTVSPGQVVAAILKHKASKELIRQLYWRDFYTYIAFHFPHVFGNAFNEKYQSIRWKKSSAAFTQWCQGKTGFPIVDAGMRELNTTGYMHNRVRMIVCSFLTKNLHIHWLWGEKYFAQKLVDYDPAVNNGNWQWGASTGADAAPYFRVFNPWLQQKKFDPECTYIKQWVPELKHVKPQLIHNAFKAAEPLAQNYPLPMVDHAATAAQAKKMFK